jgi:murein L,D-transpeptidase YcbB/YkuD
MQLNVMAKIDNKRLSMLNTAPLFSSQENTFKTPINYCVTRFLIFFCLAMPAHSLRAEEWINPEMHIAQEIATVISAKQHPFLKQTNFFNRAEDLESLYKMTGYQLLWLGSEHGENDIAEVFNLLENASIHGLNAENYDTKILQQKLRPTLSLGPTAYKELALYDTAMSLSLLRFLHDLHYGRINPQGINFNLKLREKKLADLPLLIKTALAQGTLYQLPLLVEPKLRHYQKLKAALALYRQLANKPERFEMAFQTPVRPGDNFPQLEKLQLFLSTLGDLSHKENNSNTVKSTLYTGEIVTAVKKFQKRHGLTADGVIGKGTVSAFNIPLAQRVTKIELALERLRWLPELTAGPLIIVNIPSFQLWALEDFNVLTPNIMHMKVVVGKALKNQTPVLMAEMRFIDFMPYWNVPYNIVKEEILPKLIQNQNYLATQNMELVSSTGVVAFSESSITQLKQGRLRIRQRPGGKNALGKVKFIFPNKDDVYLHDTPANTLFSRSRRDFSHGCVRVANPVGLAEFVLKNHEGWNKETIQQAMHSPKMQRVILKKPIPVLFFYITALVDQQDNLVFYPDIYGHDAVLLEALKKTKDLSDQTLFISTDINSAKIIK